MTDDDVERARARVPRRRPDGPSADDARSRAAGASGPREDAGARAPVSAIPSVSSFGGGLMNYDRAALNARRGTSGVADGDVERGEGASGEGGELISPGTLKRLNAESPVRVWGRELRMSESGLLITLSGGALFAYVAFTMTQEGVFRRATKNVKYGGVVSLCTCLVYCALAQARGSVTVITG